MVLSLFRMGSTEILHGDFVSLWTKHFRYNLGTLNMFVAGVELVKLSDTPLKTSNLTCHPYIGTFTLQ